MALSPIDISETELLPTAQNLVANITAYNQWVDAVNRDGITQDIHTTMSGILDAIRALAQGAFDSIGAAMGQWIPALGMPGDFGWSWELGQLINGCNTARQELADELAAAAV
ncbi:MAG: hypothetical protein ACR2N4_15110 [Jatrophihabitans sp.]